jgi:transcriptional regulator with XRE-family HTH domain
VSTDASDLVVALNVLDSIPAMLGAACRRRGISDREAARQIGIAPATISRIRAGRGYATDTAAAILTWLVQP